MTDADVPNAEATPGWRKHKFPLTNFLDAIKTTPIEGFNGCRYAGIVPIDWCSGAGSRGQLPALGGYLTAMLMAAACQFSHSQFPDMSEHDPLSIYVEFLQPVPQGPFHVALKVLQRGISQSTIQAEIIPAESCHTLIYTHATVRIGSLKERKTTVGGVMDQVRIPVPDRVKDCSRWVDAFFYYVNPPSAAVRCYTPNDGPNPLWSPAFGGRNVRYIWDKLDDGGIFELEHLALIIDMIPPLPLNYEENALRAITKYQMPTTSLKLDIRVDVKGQEWLLTRTHMRWLSNGRFDENIEIIDDEGNIVATCHQACKIWPARRPDHEAKTNGRL